MSASIFFDNVRHNETVHQRCLLVTGRCEAATGDDDHVNVEVEDERGRATFPRQSWPMCQGYFKALVVLAPGVNLLRFTAGHDASQMAQLSVQYVPLLQTPPLHLAILVAKDSPLLIDCPPAKFGALSSAHSGLPAAIAKLRVSAYMWQALTAEEMRLKGLGRRTFRLEEEWALETLSCVSASETATTMQTTAKVHLVRADMTVAELRDAQRAQQNPSGSRRDELHSIFAEALLAHGAPFTREARPVVAGLILDSHYDSKAKLITAHAALGAHDPNGLSLGVFGSHLTYSWPRFMEEVPDCLLDCSEPGDRVANDNGECASMWEACAVGQGAFLHEVGHAFSAPHTTGIMARGYAKDWPKGLLSKTAYCRQMQSEGLSPVTDATPNDCHWDLRDLLRFRNLPHFRLPSDSDLGDIVPAVQLQDDDDGGDNDFLRMAITSDAGIVRVALNGAVEASPSVEIPSKSVQYTMEELEARFDPDKPLDLEISAMNGKQRNLDVWKFFRNQNFIRIPGTKIRLAKTSIASSNTESDDWAWTVMLKKRGRHGGLVRASKVDIRVGCGLDGAIVYYNDGTKTPCGPLKDGQNCGMGGHQAKKIAIPEGVDIAKVAVTKSGPWALTGLRIMLANGKAMGALNKGEGNTVELLVPEKGQRIVGFYGTSGAHGMCKEFGIVTAPEDQQLPDSVYDMPELQNRSPSGRRNRGSNAGDDDDDNDTSEDSDTGYDNESDTGVF